MNKMFGRHNYSYEVVVLWDPITVSRNVHFLGNRLVTFTSLFADNKKSFHYRFIRYVI
jgi:hypothetical protein